MVQTTLPSMWLVMLLLTCTSAFTSTFQNQFLTVSTRSVVIRAISKEDNESNSADTKTTALRQEAEELLERARKLREDLPTKEASTSKSNTDTESKAAAAEDSTENDGDEESLLARYRLYVDIGRESGTWMDPRWAASGKRIDFTLDVALYSDLVPDDLADQMVQDNTWGDKTPVYNVKALKAARLRSGFDQMKCQQGGYRLDNKSTTIRFFLSVEGVSDTSYGDVSIPQGNLYFSLPCFGSPKNLSTREGPVTVRQMGWHTGWRRLESRIVGTFRAVPLEQAKKRDNF